MVVEDDWDLNAVVRGCTCTSTAASSFSASSNCFRSTNYQPAAATTSGFPAAFDDGKENQKFSLSDPLESRNSSEELHDLYKPFFLPRSQALTSNPNKSTRSGTSTTPRSKRRKNQRKKVCQVPAEALSADIWSWRKYGQKPIKGSPYPRGYYRCSSSKGCLARKQVEKNRSDPGMFTVTYSAEHNHPAPTHRNSLAGSTRQKPVSPKKNGDGNSDDQKLLSKPTSPVTPKTDDQDEGHVPQNTISESKEDKELDFVGDEEEDDLELRDMELTDDFFTGFDKIFTSPASFPDHFPATMAISSWMTNGTTAAAAGTS